MVSQRDLRQAVFRDYKSLVDLILKLSSTSDSCIDDILDFLHLPRNSKKLSDLAIQLSALDSIFRRGGVYESIDYSRSVYAMCCTSSAEFSRNLINLEKSNKLKEIEEFTRNLKVQSGQFQGIEYLAARYAYRVPNEDGGIVDHMAEICRRREA